VCLRDRDELVVDGGVDADTQPAEESAQLGGGFALYRTGFDPAEMDRDPRISSEQELKKPALSPSPNYS